MHTFGAQPFPTINLLCKLNKMLLPYIIKKLTVMAFLLH